MTPQHRPDATADLTAALRERVLVLDGAMGTMIQGHGLSEADYRGERFADHPSDVMGNNDLLSMTQPEIIGGIHRAYLEAGADLVETNTFNAQKISLADYGMEDLAYEMNVAAAAVARAEADAMTERHARTAPAGSSAPSGRRTARARSPPTSTTRAPATSPSTSSSRRTPSRPAASSTAAPTSSSSRRSSTPSTPRRRSSPSRPSSRSTTAAGPS